MTGVLRRLGRLAGVGRPMNPVLARELRQRMRGRWAPFVITFYLGLLAGVLQLVHSAYVRSQSDFDVLRSGALGRTMFQTLLFFMLLLLCFLVPGFSAGAVAGERERQTLVPLQVTLLRPRSIVFGKVLASLAFVLLLLTATLPLISVSVIVGGVGLPEVLRSMGILMLTGVLLASVSVAVSSMIKRVQAATVLAYGMTFILLAGTLIAYGAQLIITRSGPSAQPQGLLVVNPIFAVADVIGGRHQELQGGGSPFTPAQHLLRERDQPRAAWEGDVGFQAEPGFEGRRFQVDPRGGAAIVAAGPQTTRRVPVWAWSVGAWALIIALSLGLASARLRAPTASVAS